MKKKITILTEIRLNPNLGLYTVARNGQDIGQFWKAKSGAWFTNSGSQFMTYGECIDAIMADPSPIKINLEEWTEKEVGL